MRSAGGTKLGEPCCVTLRTKSRIAVFAGPVFQEANGCWATAVAGTAETHRRTKIARSLPCHAARRAASTLGCIEHHLVVSPELLEQRSRAVALRSRCGVGDGGDTATAIDAVEQTLVLRIEHEDQIVELMAPVQEHARRA